MLILSWCKENILYIRQTQLSMDYYVTINKIITRFIFSDITVDRENTRQTYNMYDLSIDVLEQYIMELCKELSGSKLDYGREWKRLKNIGGFGNNIINMDDFHRDIRTISY